VAALDGWQRAAGALALVMIGCSADTDEPAPFTDPPIKAGACGTTESLLPKLFTFVREDRVAPLRTFIQDHLLPSEENPRPDPSLRTLLDALVKVIVNLGLSETAETAKLVASSRSLGNLEPLILTALNFTTGELDGTPHWSAMDAGAHFVRRCNADHLLTAIKSLLLLQSTSEPDRLWLSVVLDGVFELIEDPFFEPFLETFEQNTETGRPAIISIFVQVMGFLAQDDFQISRVETLLESVVYPLVNEDLRKRLQRLVDLLGEATSEEAGIFLPLQRAVRCGMDHPPERNELIGFAYDLVVSEQVGLQEVLASVEGLVSEDDTEVLLNQLANLIDGIGEDVRARDDLLELVAMLLSTPDSALLFPTLIELIERDVVSEAFDAVAEVLGGCELEQQQ